MKCSDVEQVLQELLDGEPDSVFEEGPSENTAEMRLAASDVEAHLKSCPVCAELAADLKQIRAKPDNWQPVKNRRRGCGCELRLICGPKG